MTTAQLHLGDLFRSRRQRGRAGLPVFSVTMTGGLVYRDTLDRKTNGALAPEQHLLIRKGDIAYNMMRMWQGASGLADADGIVSPAYVVVSPKDGIDSLFASYWFKSARMIHLFWAFSYGITGDRLRLYYKDFARIPVTVPPKPQQERIGRILFTMDRAIAGVEKLIAAKRMLKKGLAQQLLTGQRRLPSFGKPWGHVYIGKIAQCAAGGTPSTRKAEYWGGDVPWAQSGDVHQGVVRAVSGRITELGLRNSSAKMFPANAVLIALAGQGKTRGTTAITAIPLCTNQSIAGLICKEDQCRPEFLYHNLALRYQELRSLSKGDGGRGGLTLGLIRSVRISLPPLDEQDRIAAVLGAVDRGIVLLEKKLAALRELKKGLMQKLMSV